MKLRVIFRACDKVFCAQSDTSRPFTNNKQEIIKNSFDSLLISLQGYDYSAHIIGDRLSENMVKFFKSYSNVEVNNSHIGSSGKSIIAALDQGLKFDDDDWIYTCEDDYLHAPYFMKYLNEFIENKDKHMQLKSRKHNRTKWFTGDLSDKSLFIHPTDYPDRYKPREIYYSLLFLSKYCHWRQIQSTTHTFIAQTKTLKRFENQLRESGVRCDDSYLSRKTYGKNWLRGGKALCLSPIPGLATHLTNDCMSPCIDWQYYFKKFEEVENGE